MKAGTTTDPGGGGTTPPPPLSGTTNISVLRQVDAVGQPIYNGQEATIEAVVTVDDHVADSKNSSYYVQDGTGGINIFGGTDTVAKGDKLKITGTISFYKGLTELKPTTVENIGDWYHSNSRRNNDCRLK